jgi:hypothetical protein
MRLRFTLNFVTLLLLIMPISSQAVSDEELLETVMAEEVSSGEDPQMEIVSFLNSYFERFKPLTALDMVRQVPGFQLENNNSARGFGDAPGNLLINDRRPSAKRDQPWAILSRIPAGNVDYIELIRGQVREIDLGGQSRLINIILREDVPAAIQWQADVRKSFKHGAITPSASISLSDSWAGIDYSVGLNARRFKQGGVGIDEIFDGGDMLTEKRFDDRENRNTFIKNNITASRWLGKTFVQLNTNLIFRERKLSQISRRVPEVPGNIPREEFIEEKEQAPVLEVGIDMERSLNEDLIGKLILLLFRGDEDSIESKRVLEAGGNQTLFRNADTHTVTTEGITRLEFDWSGFTNHAIQLNLEGAYNVLDGSFVQTDDTGSGPFIVTVPGANSRVEEIRGDFLLKDTWSLGKFELGYGLGAEVSNISQSGDVEQARSFFFVKPQGLVSYSHEQGEQTRLRLAREVSQLDLEDFVSAAVFEDDDLALGNPDIRPDTTWVAELSHERAFDKVSVIKLTAFHHWISDVLDLLPLTSNFEVPGNIGDGRRWGMELENTVPLEWLWLDSARLKLIARWQDSTVIDPVTGEKRVLSAGENTRGPNFFNVESKYSYNIDFRQDFEAARVAWGWSIKDRAEQLRFKVDELEVSDEGVELNTFIETTRWLGIKTRLAVGNLLNLKGSRKRTIFSGERDLSPLESQELRNRTQGLRMFITLSGTY